MTHIGTHQKMCGWILMSGRCILTISFPIKFTFKIMTGKKNTYLLSPNERRKKKNCRIITWANLVDSKSFKFI